MVVGVELREHHDGRIEEPQPLEELIAGVMAGQRILHVVHGQRGVDHQHPVQGGCALPAGRLFGDPRNGEEVEVQAVLGHGVAVP